MECRVCGAKLRKKGDLCPKCYKEMVEEEELKNDVVPVLMFLASDDSRWITGQNIHAEGGADIHW